MYEAIIGNMPATMASIIQYIDDRTAGEGLEMAGLPGTASSIPLTRPFENYRNALAAADAHRNKRIPTARSM
jgi:hypothetical protein